MDQWTIIPYQSIGPLKLSASRTDVRHTLGDDFKTFKKTVLSNLSDVYDGVHLYYDNSDNLEFIEAYEPCTPIYEGIKFLRRKTTLVVAALEKLGNEQSYDDGSYLFEGLGIALYAPATTVEAVSVFRRGYYQDHKF